MVRAPQPIPPEPAVGPVARGAVGQSSNTFDRIGRGVDSCEHLWEVRLDALGHYLATNEPEESST